MLTLATVPEILVRGAEAYAALGCGRSRGTLPFQLAGNIRFGGLFEAPFGMALGELIDQVGGGTATGRPVRAVQTGGPLGAYFPRELFDTVLDYEALAARDGLLGHGGIVVFDDTVDMARQARFAMEFCAVESCGKCTPCRVTLCVGRLRAVSRHECRASLPAGFPKTMSAILERDFGTPPSHATQTVTLEIDGMAIAVPAGTSVMRAAAEAGVSVPKLCATDTLEAFGSCRLCLVEIEGRAGTPASCTTPVAEGMKVRTQTGKLKTLRRGVMELYISDHPLDCLTCSANGDCELQDMAGAVGLREVRYGYDGANHLEAVKDESNPYFTFDPAKCIVCSRCVRACDEVQGTLALTISGRGFESKVSASIDEKFIDSECVSCGACVKACPTATLIEKTVIEIGQPERSVLTTCAYCGVGCSFKAQVRGNEVVRMVPHDDGKANRGHSCVKGRFAWGYATHPDRVLTPLVRERISDPWREATWDEAIGRIAFDFRRLQKQYGKNSVGAVTSSRCTNEETFLVQKMVRAAFGNNNVDTCARVCHSPTGYGLKTAFGTSAGTQDFDSVAEADVLIVIGANPTDGHPVFASRMKRRLREGAKLIVIDPRRIDLVRTPHIEASHHLQLRPGTNVAVVNALAHTIITEGLLDEAFVRERCDLAEFSAWAAFVAEPRNSPEHTESLTGVPAASLRAAARLYATGGNGAIYYGLGVTEHSQGTTTVDRASASTHYGARTTSRARVTWGRSPTSSRVTGMSRTIPPARCSSRLGASRWSLSLACVSRTCSMRRSTALSRGCSSRAKISPSPTPTRSMWWPLSRRWSASWFTTCS